jgi:chromosome segregation ATPase
MAITKEQVFQAAQNLNTAGQNPTLAAVRKALGGGSYSTITQYMAEWRNANDNEIKPDLEPAPDTVTNKIATMAAQIWITALDTANNRYAAEKETMYIAEEQLRQQLMDATALADELTTEIEELKKRYDALFKEALEKAKEITQLREALSASEAREAVYKNELKISQEQILKAIAPAPTTAPAPTNPSPTPLPKTPKKAQKQTPAKTQ